ncbi:unnamed protein product [Strongylus vulgaris]|uniref:Uncharacterized protein n=1 Tax=Strongylus vulgaris TaxID=40348 RepID=A0A3P7K1J0_STRVU|nr:unnamed protein product [Strongylus vulgaris]
MIYYEATGQVQVAAGLCKVFRIKVGVHHRSEHSPLLIITVMNAVTEGLKRQLQWTHFYAKDVVLRVGKSGAEVETNWNARLKAQHKGG